MAKNIKFPLYCGDEQIRTIEELQNNFCIETVLNYYHDKDNRLKKWLDVWGYHEHLKKLEELTSTNKKDIAKDLIRIFEVETTDQEIDSVLALLEKFDNQQNLKNQIQDDKLQISALMKNLTIDDFVDTENLSLGDFIELKKLTDADKYVSIEGHELDVKKTVR
ncbi:MAG: hypothetical protein ACRC4W_01610 [Treponemataceae bacterium]